MLQNLGMSRTVYPVQFSGTGTGPGCTRSRKFGTGTGPVGPVLKILVPVLEPVGTGSKTGYPVGFQPVFASCDL